MFEEIAQKIADEKSSTEPQQQVQQPVNTVVEQPIQPVEPIVEENKEENKEEKKPEYIDNTKPKEPEINSVTPVEVSWLDDEDESSKIIEKPNKELEARLAEYESILDDDDIKLIIEAKKNGKSIYDIAKEVQFEDVDKKSDREIFIDALKADGLTEEQIENDLEKFDGKTTYEQKQLVKPLRETIKAAQTSKLSKFTKGVSESALKQQEAIQKTLTIGLEEYDTLKSKFTGKEYLGLEITADRAKSIENQLMTKVNANADGSFDLRIDNVSDAYDFLVWKNYKKDLVKANIAKAKSNGAEQVLKERIRPSADNTATPTVNKTKDEELKDAVKGFMNRSNY